jgi:hypothetical protein
MRARTDGAGRVRVRDIAHVRDVPAGTSLLQHKPTVMGGKTPAFPRLAGAAFHVTG